MDAVCRIFLSLSPGKDNETRQPKRSAKKRLPGYLAGAKPITLLLLMAGAKPSTPFFAIEYTTACTLS